MDQQPKSTSAKQTSSSSQPDKATSRKQDPVARTTTPAQSNSAATSDGSTGTLTAILAEQYPAFDAEALIATPFTQEAANDAKFQEEMVDMLFTTLLKTYAWMSSRPKHEANAVSRKLESDIARTLDREKQQGMSSSSPSSSPSSLAVGASSSSSSMPTSDSASEISIRSRGLVEETRERLRQFVQQMKTALSALLGVGAALTDV